MKKNLYIFQVNFLQEFLPSSISVLVSFYIGGRKHAMDLDLCAVYSKGDQLAVITTILFRFFFTRDEE